MRLVIVALIALWPGLAYADILWPSLIIERQLLSIFPITIGLLIEWLVLRYGGFGLSWQRALVIDLTMNAVSTLAGIVLIPMAGLVWSYLYGWLLEVLKLNGGIFAEWAAEYFLAVLVTTAIEALVVRYGFKVALGKRRLSMLMLGNALSVAVALLSAMTQLGF